MSFPKNLFLGCLLAFTLQTQACVRLPAISSEAAKAYNELQKYSPKNLNLRQIVESGTLPSTRAAYETEIAKNEANLFKKYEVMLQPGMINSVPVLTIIPSHIQEPEKVIVYVHGGAFVFLSARSGLSTSAPLASELGVRIIAVDYTLAPEMKMPEMRIQIRKVIQGLLDQGMAMQDIGFLADSAGAPLVVGAVQEFLESSPKEVGHFWAIALYSPWSDLRLLDDSVTRNATVDPLLRAKDYLEVAAQLALEDNSQITNPLNSVNLLKFDKRFPPTLIQVGDREILVDQALKLHSAMTTQSVKSRVQVFSGMWHVFQSTHPDLPESQDARAKVLNFFQANSSKRRLIPD